MSIQVTGCTRQCMSNKDTQACSALDPGQRTNYVTCDLPGQRNGTRINRAPHNRPDSQSGQWSVHRLQPGSHTTDLASTPLGPYAYHALPSHPRKHSTHLEVLLCVLYRCLEPAGPERLHLHAVRISVWGMPYRAGYLSHTTLTHTNTHSHTTTANTSMTYTRVPRHCK